jgi:adenylate cyclase
MTGRIRTALSSFVTELHRRRVIKTTVAYVVAAWVLIETSSIIFPAIYLPAWSVRLIIVTAILGLPLVIVLAWVFDVRRSPVPLSGKTPDTDRDPGMNSEIAPHMPPLPDSAIASIAVLPFENLSLDEANRYLAIGLATELHSTLSRLHSVRVIARSISFLAGQGEAGVQHVARKSNARFVICGSVRTSGKRMRVTVELDNAQEGVQIWAETYDRDISDVFAVQREIALAVASAFGGARLAEEIRGVVARPTENLDAWSLVQRARSYLLAYTPQVLMDALPLLHKAISLDKDYAIAHAALASIVAECVLNGLSANRDSDRDEAMRAAGRAFALSPADPVVLKLSAAAWACFGETDQALIALRHAVDIAPFDFGAWGYLGWPLVETGLRADLDEVHEIMGRLLQLAPRYPGSSYWLYHRSVAFTCSGELESALDFAQKSVSQNPTLPWGLMNLANALGAVGRDSEARQMIDRARAIGPSLTVEHYGWLVRGMSARGEAVEPRLAGLRESGSLGS